MAATAVIIPDSGAPAGKAHTPPIGPLTLERSDEDDLQVFFPWELDNTDYLRRVLSMVTQGVRKIYARAVTREGIPKVRDYRDVEKEPADLDSHYALKHIKDHRGYYCRVFKMSLGALDDTITMLSEYRNRLAHESLGDSVPDTVLERAFSHVIHLAVNCHSQEAERNLQRLLRQWDIHRESKQTRLPQEQQESTDLKGQEQQEQQPPITIIKRPPCSPSSSQPTISQPNTSSRSGAQTQQTLLAKGTEQGDCQQAGLAPVYTRILRPPRQHEQSEPAVESVLASSGKYPQVAKVLLQGQPGSPICVALSGDGLSVAAYAEGELAVYSTTAGGLARKQKLKGHTGAVRALAMDGDGRIMASCGDDQTLRIWDAHLGKEIHHGPRLDRRSSLAVSVAISRDGRRVVVGHYDGTATIMSSARRDGDAVGLDGCSLCGHTAPVTGVAMSFDGRVVATCAQDHSARVWSGTTGEAKQVFNFPGFIVNDVALSGDGRLLATANSDSTASVFFTRREDGRHFCTVRGQAAGKETLGVSLSADGSLLATCSDSSAAILWDTRPSENRPSRVEICSSGHPSTTPGAEVTTVGVQLNSAMPQDRILQVLRAHGPGEIRSIALSADGALAATSGADGTVMLWDCP